MDLGGHPKWRGLLLSLLRAAPPPCPCAAAPASPLGPHLTCFCLFSPGKAPSLQLLSESPRHNILPFLPFIYR